MEMAHNQKHGNSKQEKGHHVREQDEGGIQVPSPKFEPCQAVGRRGCDHESERGRDHPHQQAIQKIGQKRGVLEEVPVMVEDNRVGENPRRMADDLIVGFQGTEERPDQRGQDKQGDQRSDHVGNKGFKLFGHATSRPSIFSKS
jgi:hypothetical protein